MQGARERGAAAFGVGRPFRAACHAWDRYHEPCSHYIGGSGFPSSIGPTSVSAQDLATSVVGVWKMKNFESVEVESKKVLRPFGENPAAYYVFTKGGQVHLCHLLI